MPVQIIPNIGMKLFDGFCMEEWVQYFISQPGAAFINGMMGYFGKTILACF